MKADFTYELNLQMSYKEADVIKTALDKIIKEITPPEDLTNTKAYKRPPQAGFLRTLLTEDEETSLIALSKVFGNNND